ncbi:MAG TPA: hypothetical protein VGL10_00610, partial [Gammaproteobacteria bacterium]
ESKRVYVYPIKQQYWDVRPGDTLAGIASILLPADPQLQSKLAHDIFELNPDAFIDHNPNRVILNQRLWLPNTVTRPAQSRENIQIQEYDWGYIKQITP